MKKCLPAAALLLLILGGALVLRLAPYDYAFQDRDAAATARFASPRRFSSD
jgi:hypothetical protein